MTTDPIDTMEIARAELAREMFPTPDDLVSDLSPLGMLFFTEQCVVELFKQYTAELSEVDDDTVDTTEGMGRALVAIGQALGNLDVACVAMGILPEDAVLQ